MEPRGVMANQIRHGANPKAAGQALIEPLEFLHLPLISNRDFN